jgi:hypothetical protein
MGKINMARVLLGGLLAGIVVNLFEYVANGVVLASDWETAMSSLGHAMPDNAVAGFVVWGFILGIGAVWFYASARPRFGPGPGTAAITAISYWVFAYALPNFGLSVLSLFPTWLLVIGALVGLVELILATLCGAWVYQE